jgi:hypothetical protein
MEVNMDYDDDASEDFGREEKMILRMLAELKQKHLAMLCIESRLNIPAADIADDEDDSTWYEIECERIRWDLESIGALYRSDAIEAANEALIAKHKRMRGQA